MKKYFYALAFMAIIGFVSCNQNGSSKKTSGLSVDKVVGEWKLVKLEELADEGDKAIELQECDKQTVWKFTKEEAGALGDGTEVMKVIATAPGGCKWYGFDSKWTTKDGQLFISSTKVGGIGGPSTAGLFDVKELSGNNMVLEILKYRYTFEK